MTIFQDTRHLIIRKQIISSKMFMNNQILPYLIQTIIRTNPHIFPQVLHNILNFSLYRNTKTVRTHLPRSNIQ